MKLTQHKLAVLLVAAGTFLAGTRAYAHHSLSATYYADKEVKLEGKIAQLMLRNPHSFLQIDVPDDKGVMQRWSLEWRSSGQLGQAGIKRDTLIAGDDQSFADGRGFSRRAEDSAPQVGWIRMGHQAWRND